MIVQSASVWVSWGVHHVIRSDTEIVDLESIILEDKLKDVTFTDTSIPGIYNI